MTNNYRLKLCGISKQKDSKWWVAFCYNTDRDDMFDVISTDSQESLFHKVLRFFLLPDSELENLQFENYFWNTLKENKIKLVENFNEIRIM